MQCFPHRAGEVAIGLRDEHVKHYFVILTEKYCQYVIMTLKSLLPCMHSVQNCCVNMSMCTLYCSVVILLHNSLHNNAAD